MTDIKDRSLGELERLYRGKIKHWGDRRIELHKQLQECDRQVEAYQQKLRLVGALTGTPVRVPGPVAQARKAPGKKRKQRYSPVREATLQVLRNRPGQRLTTKQIRTAIRKDTHKRVSRQSINVNVDRLETEGQIKRDRAPKGANARFVFWAV